MPCNVDITTQEILKYAEAVDPNGIRTMGVLTKPDLATEKATKDAILELVRGNRNPLRLGYFVIKNRSADDENSSITDRITDERAFFMAPPWSAITERCGIESLKSRLRELLMDITKKEIPHVKSEIEKHLSECKKKRDTLGPSRAEQSSQRLYLGKMASRFQATTQSALNGNYVGDPIFKSSPNLKLVTKMIKLNETFANIFWKRAHTKHFESKWDDEGEKSFGRTLDEVPFRIPLGDYPELHDIISIDNFECPKPLKGPIMDHIEEVFESSRGPELGTVSSS
jgi:Dynamin central region